MSSTFQPTSQQEETLRQLRIFFAERGYLIFPVAKARQYRADEFLAVPKTGVDRGKFLLVRPVPSGRIAIHPFMPRKGYSDDQRAFKAVGPMPARAYWGGRLLPSPKDAGERWWQEYIPEENREELGLLAGLF